MMSETRRMGSVESAMAQSMLDAAEEILKAEGYPALTSRRVAEHLDIKQRLVYYYFHSMDDLVLESFKRLSIRDLGRRKAALSSKRPLREVWNFVINTSDARLISEFMALSHRNEGVRQEVISFINETRKMQTKALKEAMAKHEGIKLLPPDAVALIGDSLALALNREQALGVTKAHSAVEKVIKSFFDILEP